jgi:ubiquinone/menaquinone biosynthesis C-methylase UbiE
MRRLRRVPERHSDVVQRAFTLQAEAFEDLRFNRVFTTDAEWMFERLETTPEDLVLDVAAGTGHVARALAPAVRVVVALDATPAMLAAGKAQADRAGLPNVLFQRGDAAALPFPDGSFDVVVSRFSLHHFEQPAVQLGEMARCLRPGGTFGLGDLLADADPAIAAAQDRLERLRDPSHTRMLSAAELAERLAAAGLTAAAIEARDVERPLEPWLAQTETAADVAEAIRSELRTEIGGGAVTGFRPRERDGELLFTHRLASVTAVKDGAS